MILIFAYSGGSYSSGSGGSAWSWLPWIGLALIPIAGPLIVRRMRRVTGPLTDGTAEVLSLRQFGSVAVNGPARIICRFRLRVSILGREPYEVTVWRNVAPWNLEGMGKGQTVAVQVSDSNPKKVKFGGSGGGVGPAQSRSTRTVYNLPPQVTFNQSSWSPETGWTGSTGSEPPNEVADQIKDVVQSAFRAAGAGSLPGIGAAAGTGGVLSAAQLLATGQRVPAALKSFSPTGTTPRSLGRTPSRPELIDAPHYVIEVELHVPNLAPMAAKSIQTVPTARVPSLAVGLPLTCAVNPADPTHQFAVDWDAPA